MLRFRRPLGEVDPAARDVAPTEVRFSRELGLARAVSRSLAILLAALVFTLQGSVMVSAGPAAAVSYLMMGVVCSLTLLCYVELLVRGGREGGAYVLLREATRGPVAFLTGWAILLGGLLLCAILALGFAASASTFVEALLGVRLGEPGMAALLIVVIAVYNVLGGWSHRRVRDIVTWLVAALLLLLCLVCLPRVRLTDYGPFSPHGYLGVQAGLSLLFIGFLAFESLPLTMSEIPEPRRTIPRAFLATAGLGILLSMAVTLVAGSSLTGVGLLEVRLPVAALAEECAGGYGPLLCCSWP